MRLRQALLCQARLCQTQQKLIGVPPLPQRQPKQAANSHKASPQKSVAANRPKRGWQRQAPPRQRRYSARNMPASTGPQKVVTSTSNHTRPLKIL